MNASPYRPVLVSLAALVGFLGIAWGCDGLIQFLRYQNAQTFSLTYVILWTYALTALVLAVAWLVLVRLPGNFLVSLVNLLVGLFIVAYPALYYSPLLCCGLPDLKAIQPGPSMDLYSSGGWLAVVGLAGLVRTGRKNRRLNI